MRSVRALALALVVLIVPAPSHAAEPVQVTSKISHPIVAKDAGQNVYVQVTVEGALPREAGETKRPAVNVALVIDRSGSMSGDKLAHAKQAAIAAVNQLEEDDVLSVVTYSDEAQVVVPAQKLRKKEAVKTIIRNITSEGNTALYAGTQEGAEQVRRFLGADRVNRVILLSDGLANEGPSSTQELGALGSRLMESDGISVTTFGLGLGYNEDLMAALARRSDGNHAFIEEPEHLAQIFKAEFGEISAVAAQDITVTITFADGYTPVGLLGREGEIEGRTVRVHLNQAYAGIPKDVLVEVKKAPGARAEKVAQVTTTYRNILDGSEGQAQEAVAVTYSDDADAVARAQDKAVVAEVAVQEAVIMNEGAIRLRDAGQTDEAQEIVKGNAAKLRALAQEAPASVASELEAQAEVLDEGDDLRPEPGQV